jgi:hypothetical protein
MAEHFAIDLVWQQSGSSRIPFSGERCTTFAVKMENGRVFVDLG